MPRNVSGQPKRAAIKGGSLKPLLLAADLAGSTFATAPSGWSETPLPAVAPEQVGMSKQRLDRLHDAFKQEVDEGRVAGAVVMVARRGRLAYADAVGFQDKAAGKAMSVDSIFRIYSMTK